jgi:hypothetical protein
MQTLENGVVALDVDSPEDMKEAGRRISRKEELEIQVVKLRMRLKQLERELAEVGNFALCSYRD